MRIPLAAAAFGLTALLALPAGSAAQEGDPAVDSLEERSAFDTLPADTLAAALAGDSADFPRITLEEAIARTLAASPTMAQAEMGIENAGLSRRTAIGSFLPSLSVSTGTSLASTERFDPQTNTNVTGSNDSYSARLNSSVDVYTGGRRRAQLRDAATEIDAAEATAREQRFGVVLNVKQSFYDVLRAEETVRAAEARTRRAAEALAAAELRFDVGSATRSDVLRGQLEMNDAQQSLLQARNTLNVAAFALGRLVGSPTPVGAAGEDALEPEPLEYSREQLVEIGIREAPSVRTAEMAVRSQEASVDVARAQYMPSIGVSGGYSWNNDDPSFDGGRLGWSTSLGISYPLFNGFQREETVGRSEAQLRLVETQLDDARLAVRADLERLTGAVELAERQIALTEEAVEVAGEDLRVQQERYELGASTILELLTSQVALVEAENNLISARYDYQIARAELESAIGRDL